MIGIIDYGMGNLRSVQKAFEQAGAEARILESPGDDAGGEGLSRLDKLVLPGVGAFADGMEHLRQRGWIAPLHSFVASGRPLLGICLGLQLLFDGSEEDASSPDELVPGLGLLPGRVVLFDPPRGEGLPRLKVPHMGWNTLAMQRRADPLLTGIEDGQAVYFVHSYYAQPDEPLGESNGATRQSGGGGAITSAVCDYGHRFTASVWRDNIWATQFHPEKSQQVGLRMIANFARLGT